MRNHCGGVRWRPHHQGLRSAHPGRAPLIDASLFRAAPRSGNWRLSWRGSRSCGGYIEAAIVRVRLRWGALGVASHDRESAGTLPGVRRSWKPSVLSRLWGWVAGAPSRIHYLYDSNAVRITDEDAFSSGEGADWAWYPRSGSFAPRHLGRWWRVSGSGAPSFGSLRRTAGRVRFVPNGFWASRGISDWERDVIDESVDGPWHHLTFNDGETVIRKRRSRRRS